MSTQLNPNLPLSSQRLARLCLYNSQREMAHQSGVARSTLRRVLAKFSIRTISGKERYALSNRSDLDNWDPCGLTSGIPDFFNDKKRPMVRTKYGSKVVTMSAARAIAQYMLNRYIPTFVQVCHVCGNKECTSPEHIALMPQKAHYWYDNGKRNKVHDCLILTLDGTAPGTNGVGCLTEILPEAKRMDVVSDEEWERFLINCLLEVSILADKVEPA